MQSNNSRSVPQVIKTSNSSLHKHDDTPSTHDLSKKLAPLELQSEGYVKQQNLIKDKALYRFEREMNLTQFKELMNAFQERSSQGGKLTIDEFKEEFAKVLNSKMSEEQLALILMRIGIRGEFVTWDAFCNFMLLRVQDSSHGKETNELLSPLFFPSKSLGLGRPLITPHKEMIIGFYHLESQQRYITISRDATLCHWTETFKLQKCFPNFIQTTSSRNFVDSPSPKLLPHRALNNIEQSNQVWVISFVFMLELKKWIFSTDTHELLFYDHATLQLIAKININSLALCMDYYHVKQSDKFNSEFGNADSILLVGDDQGEVIIMHFESDKLFQAFASNSKKVLQLEKTLFSFIFRKKLHNDWVKQINYDPNFKFFFSVSPDPKDSLVCGKFQGQKWKFVSSSVNKGINSFGLCTFPVALITGGADHKIRIWNPRRITNPQASLKGHLSPISDVQVNKILGHFISISTDKIIKIWDIRSQICLQTLSTGYIHRPEDYLSFLKIVNQPDGTVRIFCGSSLLLEFLMEKTPTDSLKTSHPAPIRSIICNPMCNMIISLCDNSYIHVW
ncbi:WD repeat-containing protein 49, partial [Coelomomyces lativittatus]